MSTIHRWHRFRGTGFETLRGFGFPADVAALYQEMTEGVNSGRVGFEGGHRRLYGRVGITAFLASALPA